MSVERKDLDFPKVGREGAGGPQSPGRAGPPELWGSEEGRSLPVGGVGLFGCFGWWKLDREG